MQGPPPGGPNLFDALAVLDQRPSVLYTRRPMSSLFARASRTRRRIIAAWAYDRA
jgi:hypothetical protein